MNRASGQGEPSIPGRLLDWRSAGLLLAGAVGLALLLHDVRPLAVREAVNAISPVQVIWATAAAILSFSLLALLERAALHRLGVRLGAPWLVVSASAGNAVSNTAGAGSLTGGAIRARLFSVWGLDPDLGVRTADLINRYAALGAGWLAAVALLAAGPALGWPAWATFLSNVVGAGLVGGLVWVLRKEGAIPWLAGAVAALEWLSGAAVLFLLAPGLPLTQLPVFALVYLVAHAVAGGLGAPGGLLVFEALMLSAAGLLAPRLPPAGGLAALLAYRAVYFLLPLALAGGSLPFLRALRGRLPGLRRATDSVLKALAPVLFGLLTFGAGAALLLAAATPWGAAEAARLRGWLPMEILDASHFAATLAGAALMVIGAGLARRYEGAFRLAVPVYAAAAIASLAEQEFAGAIALGLVLSALLPSRGAFDRPSSWSAMRLSPAWLALAMLGVLAFAWVGFVAYERMEGAAESRFVRGAAGVGALSLLVLLWQLSKPGRPPAEAFDAEARRRVLEAIAGGEAVKPHAWLALVGDKRLLFSESGRSFIQYSEAADFLIAMGEPVGLANERRTLVWRFLELADRFDRKPAFYAVDRSAVAELAEFGLAAQKIGESALVSLDGFSLAGSARAKLRHAINKATRDGLHFRMLAPGEAAELWPALAAVSEAWLAAHPGPEKAFSMGPFAVSYLQNTPIALVEQQGDIVAFANLQPAPDRSVVAIDLMRFSDRAPTGAMDFLFTQLLLWGAANGFGALDLGMAPLAGIDAHRRAPLASKLSALVYAYGERLYGFEGLRAYKSKFQPAWEPVFICLENRQAAPLALSAAAWLTQRGWSGLIKTPRKSAAEASAAHPTPVDAP